MKLWCQWNCDANETVCDANNVKCSIASIPIVPVKLRSNDKETIIYAMLDSCSTGTFITRSKMNWYQSSDTKMYGPRMHDSKIVTGLVVSDLNGDNAIKLPKTFTRDEIPGTETEILRPELSRKWQPLKRVAEQVPTYMTNVKIGLLIRTNCPKAIEPKDFVASKNGGPFAVLTFAGWTIVGPLCMSNNDHSVDCNRIIVQEAGLDRPSEHHFIVEKSVKELVTPEALNEMFELEFNEWYWNENQPYQEDKRFLENIQRGTKYIDGHYEMPLPFRDDDIHMPSNKEQVILRVNWRKKEGI